MINKNFLFSVIVFFFNASLCLADLKVEENSNFANIFSEFKSKYIQNIKNYGYDHSQNFKYGKQSVSVGKQEFEPSLLSWNLSGKKYYSAIGSFVPCVDSTVPMQKLEFYDTYRVCHLFIFNGENKNDLAVVKRLHIDSRDTMVGLPFCSEVRGVGLAKEVSDAILVTLTYKDNADLLFWNGHEDSKPPEYQTTILLRWHEENGQLKIDQDDSCLGNPNNIATIAEARKRLKRCQGK